MIHEQMGAVCIRDIQKDPMVRTLTLIYGHPQGKLFRRSLNLKHPQWAANHRTTLESDPHRGVLYMYMWYLDKRDVVSRRS